MKTARKLCWLIAMVGLVVMVGCDKDNPTGGSGNTNWNLTGTWNVTITETGQSGTDQDDMIFLQDGNTVTIRYQNNTGTIVGDSIHFVQTEQGVIVGRSDGKIISNNSITGTWTFQDNGSTNSGTWVGVKISDATDLPHYTIPVANITVDGEVLDWGTITPVITDVTGDGNNISGSDVHKIYLARDADHVYARIEMANGIPDQTLCYHLNFNPNYNQVPGDHLIQVHMAEPQCKVCQYVGSGQSNQNIADGFMEFNGSTIELSVPIAPLAPPDTSFVDAYCHISGGGSGQSDHTSTIKAIFQP
jgi:hypothetical protein